MVINELCGLPFDIDKRNCYTLLRDFYRMNYEIELGDYACPTDWWENGLDIYRGLAHQEGFEPVNEPPFMWQTGDVILMALGSSVGNHIGIIIPGGKMLHHLRGELSRVTQYGASFRNNTVAVYRYPGIPDRDDKELVDLKDALPRNIARKLENYIASGSAEGSPLDRS